MALNGVPVSRPLVRIRAREKESGRLQAARLTLYNIDAGKEEPGTNKDLQARIIELIGLTFDQFTRSVLLAQNDFSTFPKSGAGREGLPCWKTDRYGAILGDLPPDLRQEHRGEGGLRAAIRPRTRHRASIGGRRWKPPKPAFRSWRGAGPPGEGEGRAAKLAGGRESGRGPDRLEGKTAGGERPFLGTGVGIAENLKEGV